MPASRMAARKGHAFQEVGLGCREILSPLDFGLGVREFGFMMFRGLGSWKAGFPASLCRGTTVDNINPALPST